MPFDKAKAARVVNFIEGYLRHTKGKFASSPFLLRPWQQDILGQIFGTVREDGFRQYRTAYCALPRKNGKSEIAAAVALYLLLADQEPGAEIYSAAADRNQASIVFKVAASMVRKNKVLAKRCRIVDSTKTIVVSKTESIYRVLSADGPRQHGLNPSGVIFDEVHTQKNRDLWEALTTGSDTRSQALFFAITTAGIPGESPLWTELDSKANAIKDGLIDDSTFLPILYAASAEEDWTDEEVWRRVNPALGDFLDIAKVREAFQSAQNNPAEENSFRRLRLNQPVQQETRYIPLSDWDACTNKELDLTFARSQLMAG